MYCYTRSCKRTETALITSKDSGTFLENLSCSTDLLGFFNWSRLKYFLFLFIERALCLCPGPIGVGLLFICTSDADIAFRKNVALACFALFAFPLMCAMISRETMYRKNRQIRKTVKNEATKIIFSLFWDFVRFLTL